MSDDSTISITIRPTVMETTGEVYIRYAPALLIGDIACARLAGLYQAKEDALAAAVDDLKTNGWMGRYHPVIDPISGYTTAPLVLPDDAP